MAINKGADVYIVWIGYLFVVLMVCVAQPDLAHAAVYGIILALLPTVVVAWMLRIRRRNQRLKRERAARRSSEPPSTPE